MARAYQRTPYRGLRHSGGLLSVSRTGVCAAIIGSAMLLAVSDQESLPRIDVRVAVAPTPFKGSDGRTHLAYELVVNDIPRTGAQFDRIEVFAESDAKPLISLYAGSDLDQRVMRPDADPQVRYGRALSSTIALIHVWITLTAERVPRVLRHSFEVSTEGGQPLVAGDAPVDVRSRRRSLWDRRFARVRGWRTTDPGNTGLRIGEARSWLAVRPGFRSDTPSTSLG